MGRKVGENVGEKTGEKVGESLGEIDKLNLCQLEKDGKLQILLPTNLRTDIETLRLNQLRCQSVNIKKMLCHMNLHCVIS